MIDTTKILMCFSLAFPFLFLALMPLTIRVLSPPQFSILAAVSFSLWMMSIAITIIGLMYYCP